MSQKCTPSQPFSSCTFTCEDGIAYDLSSLKVHDDDDASDGTFNYYWSTCSPNGPKKTCLESSIPQQDIAAVQTWTGGCAVIGDTTKADCRTSDPSFPKLGLSCTFSGGDGMRNVRWHAHPNPVICAACDTYLA